MQRSLKLCLGLLVSILGVMFVINKVNWSSFYKNLLFIEPLYVLYTVLLMFVNLLFRAKRWQILLKPHIKIRLINDSFNYYSIGYMANMLLPFKPGEILRPYLLSKKLNARKTPIFATILLERLYDVLILTALFIITMLFIPISIPLSVIQPIIFIGITALFVIVFFLFLLVKPSIIIDTFNFNWLSIKYFKKLIYFSNLALEGMKSLLNLWTILYLVLLTVIIYLCSIFMVISCAKAFGLILYWYVPVIAVIITNYGMAIPSTPGSIGLAHALWVFSLMIFGIEKHEALGVAIIIHGIGFIVVVITGLISLWLEGLHFQSIRKGISLSDNNYA